MFGQSILGLAFFVFAFAIAITTIFLCFKVVMRITKYDDISLINNNNLSASLVITSSFIAMAIMVKSALYPINAVIQDFWFMTDKNLMGFLFLFGKAFGYLALTIMLSLLSITMALIIFQRLTKDIDEEQEVMKNNGAVGLLLAGVLIAFAIMVESGICDLVNALIPVSDFM